MRQVKGQAGRVEGLGFGQLCTPTAHATTAADIPPVWAAGQGGQPLAESINPLRCLREESVWLSEIPLVKAPLSQPSTPFTHAANALVCLGGFTGVDNAVARTVDSVNKPSPNV